MDERSRRLPQIAEADAEAQAELIRVATAVEADPTFSRPEEEPQEGPADVEPAASTQDGAGRRCTPPTGDDIDETVEALPAAGDVDALCAALTEEPLWHASLGSKELFHSNLLAWMVDRFPVLTRQVFEPWFAPADRFTSDRVRREYTHLDLVIELAGHEALIIENKTFALPDEQQLTRYTEEALQKIPGDPTFLLLSLVDPGWLDGSFEAAGRRWQWVSYRQLGERLAAAFRDANEFAGEVLAHEARLVLLLDDLLDVASVRHIDEPLRLTPERVEPLARANLADAVGKARAHQVMRLIRHRLQAEQLPQPAWPHEVGFSNSQPLLAVFWDKGDDIVVGWQYQGWQWRLAMILRRDGLYGRGQHEARAAFARQHLDYFDFRPMYDTLGCTEEDTLPRRSRTGPADFNRYDPAFVYRYRLLPDVTVRQFVDLATVYSRWAARWQPERPADSR